MLLQIRVDQVCWNISRQKKAQWFLLDSFQEQASRTQGQAWDQSHRESANKTRHAVQHIEVLPQQVLVLKSLCCETKKKFPFINEVQTIRHHRAHLRAKQPTRRQVIIIG